MRCIPIANDPHPFASQIHRLVPSRAVNQRSLEVVETWDVRPLPCVEDAARVDQDMARIFQFLARGQVLHPDLPPVAVPLRPLHFVVRPAILLQVVCLCKGVEIRAHLAARGICARPVGLLVKGIGVVVGREVDGTPMGELVRCPAMTLPWCMECLLPRVSILEPHAAHTCVLLVEDEREIGERALKFVCETESCRPRPDADDAQVALSMNWLAGSHCCQSQ